MHRDMRVLYLGLVVGCGDSGGGPSSPVAQASQLAFTIQPSATTMKHFVTPGVQVAVEDSNGNRVLADVTITIVLGNNPIGAGLGGTTTQTAVNGLATFSTLVIDRAASGYSLIASAPGLEGTTSSAFTVHGFTEVSANFKNTCGVSSNGNTYCWGENTYGQLGIGAGPLEPATCQGVGCSKVPLPVTGNLTFTSVSLSGAHACGLTVAGMVYCWGYNGHGELGVAGPASSSVPVAVSGGFTFASVSAGGEHSCALTSTGAAYCWGRNEFGELGDGTSNGSASPVPVAGGLTFTSIHSGGLHTCGLATNGSAYCWGYAGAGALGDSTAHPDCPVVGVECSTSPVPVSGSHTFTSMSAASASTCALTSAGTAYCWGNNDYGQLGNNTTNPGISFPVMVSGGLNFTMLSGGGYHVCGLVATGQGYCWGTNTSGELGDHGNGNSSVPVEIFGGFEFSSIHAGFNHTCAMASGGLVYCWGDNKYGMLGNSGETNTNWPGQITYP